MNRKEKTALNAVNIEDGRRETGLGADDLPDTDFNTASPPAQGVAAVLRKGEENAIDSRELLRRFHLTDKRQLRALVSNERAHGALILTAPDGGYFLPDDGEKGRLEMKRFISTIRAKGVHTLAAARPALRQLRISDGQITLDLDEALDAAGLREFTEEELTGTPEGATGCGRTS